MALPTAVQNILSILQGATNLDVNEGNNPVAPPNDSAIEAQIAQTQGRLNALANPTGPGTAASTFSGIGTLIGGNGAGTFSGLTAAAANPNNSPTGAQAGQPVTKVQATPGWYVFIAILAAVLLSSTVVGPIILGVEAVALLYQIQLLLKGQ